MLREIFCRNFRCFREGTVFPIAPLTVLVGPNNAGKSTLIDLVRLLAEEDESQRSSGSQDALYRLDFRSDDHRLSSIDRVFSEGEKELEVGVRFDTPLVTEPALIYFDDEVSVRRKYRKKEESAQLSEIEGFLLPADESNFPVEGDHPTGKRIFRIEYDEEEVTESSSSRSDSVEETKHHPSHWEAKYNWEADKPIFEFMEAHVEFVESEKETSNTEENDSSYTTTRPSFKGVLDPPLINYGLAYVNALRSRKGKPEIDVAVGSAQASESGMLAWYLMPSSFGQKFIERLELPEGWSPDYEDDLWEAVKSTFIGPFAESIEEESRPSVSYTPSYRASGREYYGPSAPITDLLEAFTESGDGSLVNKWIEEFGLGKEFQVERKGPSLYEATIEKNGERRPLADFGSGVSQVLPLILQLTQADRRDILLAEEPEANLHPDLQARLADLFGELVERKQIIVETHSEYFVRRLQYLVARGEIEPDMVQVLYIEPPEEEKSSQVRPISIDEEGQLSKPFGSGFFDQATDLMVDLFKYGSEN